MLDKSCGYAILVASGCGGGHSPDVPKGIGEFFKKVSFSREILGCGQFWL